MEGVLKAILSSTPSLLILAGIICLVVAIVAPSKINFLVDSISWSKAKQGVLGIAGIGLLGLGLVGVRVIDVFFPSDTETKEAAPEKYYAFIVDDDKHVTSASLSMSMSVEKGVARGKEQESNGNMYNVTGYLNARRLVLTLQGISAGRGEALYVMLVGSDPE
jgi:hypothetical protein